MGCGPWDAGWDGAGGHRRVPGPDALVNSTAPGRPRSRSEGWGRKAQTSPRSAGGARCSRPSGAEEGSAPLEPPSHPQLRAVTCKSRGCASPAPLPSPRGAESSAGSPPRSRGFARSLALSFFYPAPPSNLPSGRAGPVLADRRWKPEAGSTGERKGSVAARCAAPGPAAGLCKRRPRGAVAS